MHIAQRCGTDAVVVRLTHGAGQAIWWSSAQPLTNRGLHNDASLKLLLASLPTRPGERILFDEYFHGARTSLWENARGLPIAQLVWQTALVAVLLVLSFGRRNGPLRAPVTLPRTSPIEFAESMGRLYRAADATQAATEGARKRLLLFLAERCGVPRLTLPLRRPRRPRRSPPPPPPRRLDPHRRPPRPGRRSGVQQTQTLQRPRPSSAPSIATSATSTPLSPGPCIKLSAYSSQSLKL